MWSLNCNEKIEVDRNIQIDSYEQYHVDWNPHWIKAEEVSTAYLGWNLSWNVLDDLGFLYLYGNPSAVKREGHIILIAEMRRQSKQGDTQKQIQQIEVFKAEIYMASGCIPVFQCALFR